MEHYDLDPLGIYDEKELPHPKREILSAVTAAYKVQKSNRGLLANALSFLAQFQEGVGEPIEHPTTDALKKISESKTSGDEVDALALARLITESAADTKNEERRKYLQSKVEQERQRYQDILSKLNL